MNVSPRNGILASVIIIGKTTFFPYPPGMALKMRMKEYGIVPKYLVISSRNESLNVSLFYVRCRD